MKNGVTFFKSLETVSFVDTRGFVFGCYSSYMHACYYYVEDPKQVWGSITNALIVNLRQEPGGCQIEAEERSLNVACVRVVAASSAYGASWQTLKTVPCEPKFLDKCLKTSQRVATNIMNLYDFSTSCKKHHESKVYRNPIMNSSKNKKIIIVLLSYPIHHIKS